MFKKIFNKILVAYAFAKIEAEEKRQKKEAEREQKKEKRIEKRLRKETERDLLASVNCPYCAEHYTRSEACHSEYLEQTLKLREIDYDIWISLSFIKCRSCGEMFGITQKSYGSENRSSFRLKK